MKILRNFLGVLSLACFSFLSPPALLAQSTPSKLTPELMDKMLKLVASRGIDRTPMIDLARALGLTIFSDGWPDRQITFSNMPNNGGITTYGYAVSRRGDQDLIFIIRRNKDLNVYRSDRDGKVLAALVLEHKIKKIDEAQLEIDTEIDYLAANVDSYIARKN